MKYNQKYPLYLRAYIRVLKQHMQELEEEREEKETLLKVVFYGIKTALLEPKPTSYKESIVEFQTISALKQIIAKLTPNEFMNMFPVEKDFKGYKYEMKDYYSSMEYVNTLDLNKPIGDNVLMLLGEYMNKDIHRFFVKSVINLSHLRQYDGHIDMFEEFMASQGMETPNTFKNAKGEPMYIKNGKPTLVEKIKTNKLELVK